VYLKSSLKGIFDFFELFITQLGYLLDDQRPLNCKNGRAVNEALLFELSCSQIALGQFDLEFPEMGACSLS